MDRYIRHCQLADFGPEAQEKVCNSRALIIGCGALGTVCGMYLAGSGVGKITVVDFDTIDITNLQRQLSFTEGDIGKPKACTLAEKMRKINSSITVDSIEARIEDPEELKALISNYDVVIEASDNPKTKYLVTSAAEAVGVPYAFGGIAQTRGQAMSWRPGYKGYSVLFPEAGAYDTASQAGVFSPLPGIIASIQAAEALKLLSGAGTPLLNRMLVIDAMTMSATTLEF